MKQNDKTAIAFACVNHTRKETIMTAKWKKNRKAPAVALVIVLALALTAGAKSSSSISGQPGVPPA